jgi:hypothetical protein
MIEAQSGRQKKEAQDFMKLGPLSVVKGKTVVNSILRVSI